MMFAKMGVANDKLAFFTSLLYFPWFLKGLWSPFIDTIRTKRWWIITMQLLITILCVLLTMTLPYPDAQDMLNKTTPIGPFWITLVLFIFTAFASATHDIAADGYYMLAHDSGSQSKFIGIRSTFYRISMLFVQGGLVYIAGIVEQITENVPVSWQITLGCAAFIMCLATLYHIFTLPKVEVESGQDTSFKVRGENIKQAFSTFFTKPGILLAILFMLLYRLPEGLLIKLAMPFLVDNKEVVFRDGQIFGGGLGLDTATVGVLYGTFGVIALLAGGILGGLYISKRGLKHSLWPMAAMLTLPNIVYVLLSAFQPDSLWLIGSAIVFEQFGYGFGFTAYMLYMMYFSDGEYKTSHYAICTAFMALSMMLPGFVAGSIELAVGYQWFFWIAIFCSIATALVTWFVHRNLNESYGKEQTK